MSGLTPAQRAIWKLELHSLESVYLNKLAEKDKTIALYQDVADALVAKGVALEQLVELLRKNQKKPRKKRTV